MKLKIEIDLENDSLYDLNRRGAELKSIFTNLGHKLLTDKPKISGVLVNEFKIMDSNGNLVGKWWIE